MEIDANINSGAVNGLPPSPRAGTGAKPVAASDSFTSSADLDAALKDSPDIRPDAVARGLALVSNPNYPSADEVKKLSGFLANQLKSLTD
jgi:hypothetical protein